MTDDDRFRFLYASAFEGGMPTDACPDAMVLLAAYSGDTTQTELTAVLDHMVLCSVCSEAWRLAARMLAATP